MKKYYAGMIYSLDGAFKSTINPKDVKSRITFTSQLNGGQGQFNLILNKTVDYDKIINTDIVKIYQIDTNNPGGRLIYSGIVQNIQKNINASFEEINIPLLGLGSIFTYKTFNGNKNQEVATSFSDFINLINTNYNLFTKDLDNTGSTINMDFEYENVLNACTRLKDTINYDYYIAPSGKVSLKAKKTTATHNMKLGKEVEYLNRKINTENLVNKLILKWSGGTTTYEDTTSQTTYGVKEKYITNTDLKDQASADEFGNNYISENKIPITETVLGVNLIYDIESVTPGDTLSIYNTDVQNKKILKVKYTTEGLTLYLENYSSFGVEVLNLQN